MDLVLTRNKINKDGCFGTLSSGDAVINLSTLEHAYAAKDIWTVKIPPGKYKCVYGKHQLSDGKPFKTYEVTGVPGHSGLLFHVGNFDNDSSGCILLGTGTDQKSNPPMVVNSHLAFATFMNAMVGDDFFYLTVRQPEDWIVK